MKFFLLLSLITLCACTPTADVEKRAQAIPTQKGSTHDVNERIAKALALKDYRLLGMSGRRVTAPGIAAQEMSEAIKRCGIQLLPRSGDVLRTAADRARRRSLFQLAEQFNQQIHQYCLQNTQE